MDCNSTARVVILSSSVCRLPPGCYWQTGVFQSIRRFNFSLVSAIYLYSEKCSNRYSILVSPSCRPSVFVTLDNTFYSSS